MKKNISNRKNFIWNTVGTTINAFNSLFFMIIVTRINGINDAGIFTYAFSTACLFNVIGIYSGRVYQVTDNSEITDNDYFINKIITCFIMLLVTIAFLCIKGYSIWKTSIILVLCVLKTIEAFSEVIYAFFQKKDELYKVGISFTLKNVIGLIAFLIANLLTKNVLFSSIVLLVTYFLIMLIYDLKNVDKKPFSIKRINWKNIWAIFQRGFFSFSLSFLTMYIINIPRYAIDDMMTNEFSSIFGIIIMPASVMVLISQFILHPFLLNLRNYISDNNTKGLRLLITKMTSAILLIGILILVVAYFLGIPILEFVYNIDLFHYKNSLMVVIVGSVMYGIVNLLSNILISMRVIFKQVIVYAMIAMMSLTISNVLIQTNGVEGACQSYCIVMLINLISFIILTLFSVKQMERND